MRIQFFLIIILFRSSVKCLDQNDGNKLFKNAYELCHLRSNQLTFDVLPGSGWDNLANMGMGRILDLNFSKCSFSNDNKYLIPNQLAIYPQKTSQVEISSEIFRHFSNYTSMSSQSINLDAEGLFGHWKIGGSFSTENTKIKSDQMETKSILTRVQLRYLVFQSMFEPDTPLYPTFKNRIIDIAGLVIENKDSLYPEYLADMIVRDYGTHVIRAIDAGAILSKTDALNSRYVKKYASDSSTISVSASASFLGMFKISGRYQTKTSQTNIDEFNHNADKTHIDTVGGAIFGANMSLSDWENSVMNNLVPIDRRGEPLYYAITPRALPELDQTTVHKVTELLKKAISRYYMANGRIGCLDIYSPNFNPDANIDSGNCEHPSVNFTFGGTYQVCGGPACGPYAQVNPLTGGFSCPSGFISIKLHSGLVRCDESCHGWWFWRSCDTTCSYFTTFWCYPVNIGPNYNGYQFGGIRQGSCPIGYIPLKVALSTEICVTVDADPFNPYAIKFGGFFSCSAGNPLAKEYVNKKPKLPSNSKMEGLLYWPKTCAKGYVAHIVSIEQGCQISYCTETNKVSLGPLPLIIKPPFISTNYNPNSTKVFLFKNKKGETIIKDDLGYWKIEQLERQKRDILIGSIIGSLLTTACICLIVFFVQRRHYKQKIGNSDCKPLINNEQFANYCSINNTEPV